MSALIFPVPTWPTLPAEGDGRIPVARIFCVGRNYEAHAASTLHHLQPGDVIMTGTPSGVGAVRPGDRLEGEVEGVGRVELHIWPAEG